MYILEVGGSWPRSTASRIKWDKSGHPKIKMDTRHSQDVQAHVRAQSSHFDLWITRIVHLIRDAVDHGQLIPNSKMYMHLFPITVVSLFYTTLPRRSFAESL